MASDRLDNAVRSAWRGTHGLRFHITDVVSAYAPCERASCVLASKPAARRLNDIDDITALRRNHWINRLPEAGQYSKRNRCVAQMFLAILRHDCANPLNTTARRLKSFSKRTDDRTTADAVSMINR